MSLRLISAADLLAEGSSELDWVLYPLATKGSAVMIYGRQGLGKSSVIMQLCDSLVHGNPWLGFGVRKTGPVIYLQLDMATAEMRRLLERARDAGLEPGKDLHVPWPESEAEMITFNVLNENEAQDLRDLCEQIQPVAVIVDTIHDAYDAPPGSNDVNANLRKVIAAFQKAIAPAVLVYINHQRKGSALAHMEEKDDEDSFMGGQVLEGKVAASLRLRKKRQDQSYWLEIKKLRLDQYPATAIQLEKTANGFFKAKQDYRTMLMQWPDCLPPEEREQAIAWVKTKSDVFKDIARLSGSKEDTVKQQFYRNRGVDYHWLRLLPESEREVEVVAA